MKKAQRTADQLELKVSNKETQDGYTYASIEFNIDQTYGNFEITIELDSGEIKELNLSPYLIISFDAVGVSVIDLLRELEENVTEYI